MTTSVVAWAGRTDRTSTMSEEESNVALVGTEFARSAAASAVSARIVAWTTRLPAVVESVMAEAFTMSSVARFCLNASPSKLEGSSAIVTEKVAAWW